MSDEKKAESLAESATDFIVKFIKKNANVHDDTNEVNSTHIEPIYYLLRAPLKANGSGENFKLDVSQAKPVEKVEDVVNFMGLLEPSIKEIGWEGKVEITSSCELANAEFFTPYDSDYKVPTIDYPHLLAEGKSAKFLDDVDDSNSGCENYSEDWAPSDWKLRLKFPNGEPLKEEIEIKTVGRHKLDVDLEISRMPEDNPNSTDMHIEGHTEVTFANVDVDFDYDLKIQEKMDDSNIFPDLDGYPKNMRGIRDAFTNDTTPRYEFSKYVSEIKSRKSTLDGNYKKYIDGFNINDTDLENSPYYIEKGGVLRITTNVKYKKTDTITIEKNLVTEIPFKVSDLQPMAPEYTFFIANSTNVSDQGDIVDSVTNHKLGDPIEMNKNTYASYNADPPAGAFIVHNVPVEGNKINYSAFDKGDRVPGMVRINSDFDPGSPKATKVKSFLGIKDQPYLNELNKFFTPFNEDFTVNKFNTRVSFLWEGIKKGNSEPARYHEIEFPLLFEKDRAHESTGTTGMDNILQVFKTSGFQLYSVPTLLFGICHMEYPLGLRAEGPINSEFSRLRIFVNPEQKVGAFYKKKDRTKVWFDYVTVSTYAKDGDVYDDYTNSSPGKEMGNGYEPATFGMQDYKGYNPNASWNSNGDYQYSPANCYDALQYAKKATKYYENEKEFNSDLDKEVAKGGLKDTDGSIKLNGVYYIKDGDLTFSKAIKYSGHGLIVCKKGIITISKNIERKDDKSSLGIIARIGYIRFNTSKVVAACFSNNAPDCTNTKMDLYGNLVCNNFVRKKFVDVNIYYDNTVCNVTPFASLRKIGKLEPKRYAVAFSDNFSKYAFEQAKEQNNQP